MSLLLYAVVLFIVLNVLLYRRYHLKLYFGIRCSIAAANRLSGDLPDLLAHDKKTKEAFSFFFFD